MTSCDSVRLNEQPVDRQGDGLPAARCAVDGQSDVVGGRVGMCLDGLGGGGEGSSTTPRRRPKASPTTQWREASNATDAGGASARTMKAYCRVVTCLYFVLLRYIDCRTALEADVGHERRVGRGRSCGPVASRGGGRRHRRRHRQSPSSPDEAPERQQPVLVQLLARAGQLPFEVPSIFLQLFMELRETWIPTGSKARLAIHLIGIQPS
jgi:hypothetical protein